LYYNILAVFTNLLIAWALPNTCKHCICWQWQA